MRWNDFELAVRWILTTGITALVVGCAGGSSNAAPAPEDASTGVDGASTAPFGTGGLAFPEDASISVQARYVLGGCAGGPEMRCHGAGIASENLTLPDTTPSNLVDVPSVEVPDLVRVRPGDPASSYLYLKVTGSPRIQGVRMPKDSTAPLDARSLEVLAAWIDAGAP